MDRELVDAEIKRLSEELARLKVGTPEYKATIDALKDLHSIRVNEDRAESERIERNMTLDLRREELEFKTFECEQKAKIAKHSDRTGFWKSVICGLIAIGGVFCLDEIKEDQGFVDKDKFSIIKTLFPRG